MVIRPARPEEAALLSDLAIRSKAAWGYEAAMMDAFRAELTLDAGRVRDWHSHVAMLGDRLAGFYALSVQPDGRTGEIEMMFVDPDCLRQGIGRALWRHMKAMAKTQGLKTVLIDSDPHAEPFYLSMGAIRIGDVPSCSLPGRMLPRLEMRLAWCSA